MKQNWAYKKLGEICESDLGKTLNSKTDKGELFPYLCAVNILWDNIDLTTLKYTKFEASELERYSVRKGDLLVCEGGDIGRAAIWDKDEPIQYQNALHRIRFNGEVLPRFCLQYLHHLKNIGVLDNNYGKGVTIKHLVKSSLLSILIPLPPLATQTRIVSELDLLQSLIDKQKAQLKEYDTLAQSIFYDMFGDPVENEKGWEVKKLGSFCSKIGSGATPRGGNESYKSEGISLIRSLNVHNNEFIYKDLAFIDEEQAQALSNVEIQLNDILLNITGASVARCCIVPNQLLPARVNQHVCIIRPSKDAEVRFLSRLLTNSQYQVFLIDLARGKAATREALPKNIVEGLPIILPPLSLQQSFAAKIESIEKQKAAISKSIAETEKLFEYTMDKYFG